MFHVKRGTAWWNERLVIMAMIIVVFFLTFLLTLALNRAMFVWTLRTQYSAPTDDPLREVMAMEMCHAVKLPQEDVGPGWYTVSIDIPIDKRITAGMLNNAVTKAAKFWAWQRSYHVVNDEYKWTLYTVYYRFELRSN